MKKLTVLMAVLGCVMAEMLAMNVSAETVNTQAVEMTYEAGDTSHCMDWENELPTSYGEEVWDETGVSGSFGELHWRIDMETHEMTISGNGSMNNINYPNYAIAPWEEYKLEVQSLIIEEGITSIGNYVFLNFKYLQSASIPDTVTSIGKSAFSGCGNLESVNIPDTVTSIGAYAFEYCKKLKSVNIPPTITTIESSVFSYCESLTSVKIPESVTKIRYNAFQRTGLTEIVIPDNVEILERAVFAGCENLEQVTFSKNLAYVGNNVFWGTAWYNKLERDENGIISSDGIIFNAHEEVKEQSGSSTSIYTKGTAKGDIVLPDDTKIIAGYAFCDCSEMTSIVIPDSVKSIGEGAFQGCSKLESITIPDGITKIESGTFEECHNLKTINLPDSITQIGYWAFKYCMSLEEITLPPNITRIEDYTFMGCDSLESVTFPENVEELGDLIFGYESNIKDITVLNPHCRFGEICKRGSETVKFNQPVTMHGYPYSTAQAFAEVFGWNFVPITAVSGDANGDGSFSLVDVVQVHKMLHTRKAPPKSCDMNKDNKVNVIDLSLMKQKLFKKQD